MAVNAKMVIEFSDYYKSQYVTILKDVLDTDP
jgi:hypothetical protein